MSTFAVNLAATMIAIASFAAQGAGEPGGAALSPTAIRVAKLSYEGAQTQACFSDLFLRLAAYETGVEIDPELHEVPIDSDALFAHPFAVLTGEGAFELTEREVAALREHLLAGAFVIASPGCSSAPWAASMEHAIARMFPDPDDAARLEEIPLDHAIFSALYEIPGLTTADGKPPRVLGLRLHGRLAMIFSPSGLNDSETAGQGCCCCGTGEIRQARFLNANLLVYALLQ